MLMQFYREESVPDVVKPGVCYITRDGVGGGAVMHFVSKDGTSIHTLAGAPPTGVDAIRGVLIVADIAERDGLTLAEDSLVLVIDGASGPNELYGWTVDDGFTDAVSGGGGSTTGDPSFIDVADIAERNALTLTQDTLVLVKAGANGDDELYGWSVARGFILVNSSSVGNVLNDIAPLYNVSTYADRDHLGLSDNAFVFVKDNPDHMTELFFYDDPNSTFVSLHVLSRVGTDVEYTKVQDIAERDHLDLNGPTIVRVDESFGSPALWWYDPGTEEFKLLLSFEPPAPVGTPHYPDQEEYEIALDAGNVPDDTFAVTEHGVNGHKLWFYDSVAEKAFTVGEFTHGYSGLTPYYVVNDLASRNSLDLEATAISTVKDVWTTVSNYLYNPRAAEWFRLGNLQCIDVNSAASWIDARTDMDENVIGVVDTPIGPEVHVWLKDHDVDVRIDNVPSEPVMLAPNILRSHGQMIHDSEDFEPTSDEDVYIANEYYDDIFAQVNGDIGSIKGFVYDTSTYGGAGTALELPIEDLCSVMGIDGERYSVPFNGIKFAGNSGTDDPEKQFYLPSNIDIGGGDLRYCILSKAISIGRGHFTAGYWIRCDAKDMVVMATEFDGTPTVNGLAYIHDDTKWHHILYKDKTPGIASPFAIYGHESAQGYICCPYLAKGDQPLTINEHTGIIM